MESLAARQLMVGTALVESGLTYLKQINGSAIGVFQVEHSTWLDNYFSYLDYRPELKKKFESLSSITLSCASQMAGNLYYNTAHARLKYWRDKAPLPKVGDYEGLAKYHKRIYNSVLGKTDLEKSIGFFLKATRLIKV